MDEQRIIELFAKKFSGEASAQELTELDALLIQYPDAATTGDILQKVWSSPVESKDPDLFYQRHTAKHREVFNAFPDLTPGAQPVSQGVTRLKGPLFAVSVLMTVIVGYFLIRPAGETHHERAFTQIISGKGVRKSVMLPDGTRVFLNASSMLSFDPGIKQNKLRRVNLQGEAYFDVKHDADHPFVIHTEKISIRVLGTAFNVKAYPNEMKCETTLIRGSIELTTNAGSTQKFILRPSEKFTLIDGKAGHTSLAKGATRSDEAAIHRIEHIEPVMLSTMEYIPETSWTQNKLIFDNESLEELAPKLERWYNVNINIVGTTSSGQRFTGAFANETIDQALTAMKLVKPFNFTIHDKDITIY